MFGLEAPVAASLGQLGGEYITDTNAHTPPTGRVIGCVVALEAAVGALVSNRFAPPAGQATAQGELCTQGTLSAMVLPVGVPVFGSFSSITLASGKVIVYYA
jgi:hypothetical protein